MCLENVTYSKNLERERERERESLLLLLMCCLLPYYSCSTPTPKSCTPFFFFSSWFVQQADTNEVGMKKDGMKKIGKEIKRGFQIICTHAHTHLLLTLIYKVYKFSRYSQDPIKMQFFFCRVRQGDEIPFWVFFALKLKNRKNKKKQ